MAKKSTGEEGESFPRLSDVSESSEDALHTTQINLAPEAFERFADVFEGAVRRWERIIYPALLILVLVMAYGFFLMYHLGKDMRLIAEKFDPNMGFHMESLSRNMNRLTGSIHEMHQDMKVIAKIMPEMNDKLTEMKAMRKQVEIMNKRMLVMNAHMEGMNRQMSAMNSRMYVMTGSVTDMNRSIGRPMTFMNSFMPW